MRTIIHFREFGHTKKAHGKDGFLKLHIELKDMDQLASTDFLFLDVEGSKVPFLITELVGGSDLLVKFEDVDSPEAAAQLTGKSVWIPTDQAEQKFEEAEDDLEFGKLKGYSLIDKELGELGMIDRVEAYPQQEMAIFQYQDQEVMVPLHVDLIISIDAENQKIEMDLPEGLF